MQKKDQTFSKFCEFKSLVEKYVGNKVKAPERNNGGDMCRMNLRTSMHQKEFYES